MTKWKIVPVEPTEAAEEERPKDPAKPKSCRISDMARAPDGFYWLDLGGTCCLVRLYTPDDSHTRGVGFGMWDGAGFIPLDHLMDGATITLAVGDPPGYQKDTPSDHDGDQSPWSPLDPAAPGHKLPTAEDAERYGQIELMASNGARQFIHWTTAESFLGLGFSWAPCQPGPEEP